MGRMRNLLIPGVDKMLLVRDAVKTMPDLTRRRFITGGASLGALTLLTGCDVTDSFSADRLLAQISKFNDGVQALIFNPNTLAPTFPDSAITRPFPFNAYYDEDEAPAKKKAAKPSGRTAEPKTRAKTSTKGDAKAGSKAGGAKKKK